MAQELEQAVFLSLQSEYIFFQFVLFLFSFLTLSHNSLKNGERN